MDNQQQSQSDRDTSSDQPNAEPRSGEGSESALARMKSQERSKADESPEGGSSHPSGS